MQRKKGVMSLTLFEKIVREYAGMGGVSVNLTPIMGDVLLDPHLLKRLEILKRHPGIKQIIITTNGIALEKYSDQEICCLLENLFCIQLSIGGLDPETYTRMYGVDRFSQVKQGMERLLRLKDTVLSPAHISFAFRTNDRKFETRFKCQLDNYRKRGVSISHISTYANYSGAVSKNGERGLMVYANRGKKHLQCVSASLNTAVCWDGTITACCGDFEGNKLRIGHAEKETSAEVWFGKKRSVVLESFSKGKLFPICRRCSGYKPDTIYASPIFKGVQPNQPLPLEFFL
jgi:hypothetical protein